MVATSTMYPDLLDARFKRIFNETFGRVPEIIGKYYSMGAPQGGGIDRYSALGTFGDLMPFLGTVTYDDFFQLYDTQIQSLEFTSGHQVDRKLRDDAMFVSMDQKPKALASSLYRTRQKHAVRLFTNAFSVDNYFYVNSEGVAMCSNSHTNTSGASTATGYDNLVTTGLSAVSLAAARVQMVNFRGDRAEKINVQPSLLVVPEQGSMHETAWEILNSSGKLDTANNNRNFVNGMFQLNTELWLEDANDWFLFDSSAMKENQIWIDRVSGEYDKIEDFDTLVLKHRVYGRWGNAHIGWRHVLGAQVS
jgi:hypothetical protein